MATPDTTNGPTTPYVGIDLDATDRTSYYTYNYMNNASGIWNTPRQDHADPFTGETVNMASYHCVICGEPASGDFVQNNNEALCGLCLKCFTIEVFNLFREHNEKYRQFYEAHPEIESATIQIPMETFKKFRDIRL